MCQHGRRPTQSQYIVWLGGLALSLAASALLGLVALRLLREARARAMRAPKIEREKPLAIAGAPEKYSR
jgi:hypothetical protein